MGYASQKGSTELQSFRHDMSLGRSDFRLSGEVKPGLHPFGLNLLHSVISLKDMRHSLWVQD